MCVQMCMHPYKQIFIYVYISIFPVYYTKSFPNILPDSEIHTLTGQGTGLEESRSETPHKIKLN